MHTAKLLRKPFSKGNSAFLLTFRAAGTPLLALLLIEMEGCDRNILYSLLLTLFPTVSKLPFYKFIHWSAVNHAKHSRPLVLCEFSVTGFYSF